MHTTPLIIFYRQIIKKCDYTHGSENGNNLDVQVLKKNNGAIFAPLVHK